MKYSIQPHGKPGNFILLLGCDNQHHGYNLCTLSDFDNNGEMTRESIVEGLNDKVRLERENAALTERLARFEALHLKVNGKDPSFTKTLARQLHKHTFRQPFDQMTAAEQAVAIKDAEEFLAMVFE